MTENINYLKQLDALNKPWIESPFFHKQIKKLKCSEIEIELSKQFNSKGYVIIDLELDGSFIDDLIFKINILSKSKDLKTNTDFFSYNDGPRIVDAGKHISKVVDLALNDKILSLLRFFYRKEPIPFSTINFLTGTEQPLHSDTIHFGTMPRGYLSAAWIALEDTDENNGALRIIEGSHKLEDINYFDLKLNIPKNKQEMMSNYRNYEQYVKELKSALGLKEKIMCMKKGSVLIWAANLLHGGSIINDRSRSRYSQVTHYNFEGCDYYFHPFFSKPIHGKYYKRHIDEIDIRKLKR